jgi:GAF domain-containing protein
MPLPPILQDIFNQNSDPDAVFKALLPPLCEILQSDRCFLYLRHPQYRIGKIAYCWRRNLDVPDVTDAEWTLEPKSLPNEDPLFAAALRTDPSVYVEDVEVASPDVVSVEFERKYFGHRALIHSHLCQAGEMWGVLQPCLFGQPRVWTEGDRQIISQLEEKLTPLAIAYVKAAGIEAIASEILAQRRTKDPIPPYVP